MGALTPSVQAAVKRLFTVQLKGLTTLIEAGTTAGEFTPNGRSSLDLAQWILASVQGGLLLSRVMGDIQPLQSAVTMIQDFFA